MRQVSLPVFALACVLLSACENFDPGSLIATPRVLGARVEVRGEPARAAPKPGELADIRWITAWPGEAGSFSWAFAVCSPVAAASGSCAHEPFAFEQGSGLEPAFTLIVPSAEQLAELERLVVLGLICDRGTPGVDAQGTPRCEGEGAHGTSVTLDVALDRSDRGNLNPELDDAEIKLDGQAWDDTSEASSGACASDETITQVPADGKKHVITLRLGADVREFYTDPETGRSGLEALQLSHFVTAGELAGQYSFVEADDPEREPELSVTWHAPKAKQVAEDGELVRFIFVLRDLRGGVAATERALCAVR